MARPCGNCQKVGHGKKDCPGLKKRKPTGGGTRSMPRPAPAVAEPNGIAARITGLKQLIAAGLEAQAELDAIRAALEA